MDIREEFEKLHEVKNDIENYKLRYNKKLNAYTGLDGKIKSDAIWVNGAWYAFQEQQKKIDDVFLENAKLKHVIDQVKLHNGSLGFRSMQRIIEELLK